MDFRKTFQLMVSESWILLTNQFQPYGFDSISCCIALKRHEPTSIEPNSIFIKSFDSKPEYDSTTHERTTFWYSTFDMKNENLETLRSNQKFYIALESSCFCSYACNVTKDNRWKTIELLRLKQSWFRKSFQSLKDIFSF